jgi:hypothetical protein
MARLRFQIMGFIYSIRQTPSHPFFFLFFSPLYCSMGEVFYFYVKKIVILTNNFKYKILYIFLHFFLTFFFLKKKKKPSKYIYTSQAFSLSFFLFFLLIYLGIPSALFCVRGLVFYTLRA